jgi:hypothetical protein
VRVPNYRELTPAQEESLLERNLNRITDTCIPEEEAIRVIEDGILDEWTRIEDAGERYFAHEFLYRILRSGRLADSYQIDPADSWLMAAAERDLPIFVPGWEDSTCGNIFTSHCLSGRIGEVHKVRTGVEYMMSLAGWYGMEALHTPIGFFQIGGGIAGDFPSAWSRCCARTWSATTCRCGASSARSATPPRATARTRARCPPELVFAVLAAVALGSAALSAPLHGAPGGAEGTDDEGGSLAQAEGGSLAQAAAGFRSVARDLPPGCSWACSVASFS